MMPDKPINGVEPQRSKDDIQREQLGPRGVPGKESPAKMTPQRGEEEDAEGCRFWTSCVTRTRFTAPGRPDERRPIANARIGRRAVPGGWRELVAPQTEISTSLSVRSFL
ncbi:hypothetical protein [Bradyrhizobium liaoningense]|uniref:hypothetical protein n=1 Tax=Bradyrhizobium liaoningense TaxID=43992 RepID=UPI001BA4FF9E|nr:hypothetical protein [Bradyrhizobium liaoningense]MBR0904159.1 hypothetical protein [Bradyrhizobium liaoningense]